MEYRFCPRCAGVLVDRPLAGDGALIRRACPDQACAFVHWGNPTPAVGALVEHEVREELGLEVTETHLIGNYIFERKNEVMLCYHAVARGFQWDERPAMSPRPGAA